MIKITNLTKTFGNMNAVNHITFSIPDGVIYGILGTNGAGKSTLLRMLAGIMEPDTGEIYFDGENNYDNPTCKNNIFYLSDTPYYFPNADIAEMIRFYQRQYLQMDTQSAANMAELLRLDLHQPIRTFSKGMKRQAFLILALCAKTKYILCDEVFDGLDPMITETMKNFLRQEMKERELTIVVVSHKLQDLENICHHISILHQGGLLKSGDLTNQSKHIHKYQCVFTEEDLWEQKMQALKEQLSVIRFRKEQYFVTLIVREENEAKALKTKEVLNHLQPVFCREVPMTLEETFIAEMEEAGYDIEKVLH